MAAPARAGAHIEGTTKVAALEICGFKCSSVAQTPVAAYHPSTAPNIACSAKIAKSTGKQLGECDEDPDG